MNKNYIVINGKRLDLTEEQLKQFGIEPEKKRKNPFERVKNEVYFSIGTHSVLKLHDSSDEIDKNLFTVVNYFTDKDFAKQVALHQLLYRKLLKFAYDNECEDSQIWDGNGIDHWHIGYDFRECVFYADWVSSSKNNDVYFSTKEGAERAIHEVIEPFMQEYPEFVW